ncbi:hypothetical protein FNO25_003255 [Vibrio fluvialis]|nr:hypothetical protein [Vibrio fluvialis]MBY7855992.1 hypothetical protein [Vibrio fluvialis]MBY7901749.1 hypothetical protein [Vibrio fluvialis]MBY7940780.1 hypothetical protein [Vibrio fluvialis]
MRIDISKYKNQIEAENALRQDYEGELPSTVLDSLCREFIGWIDSGDTDYLDAAVSLLYANKVPIKGRLFDEVGKLAEARLSREVEGSSGARNKQIKYRRKQAEKFAEPIIKQLETKNGCNKYFISEPAVKNVFVLVKICGFYELPACFYAACINEENKGRPTFKRISAGRVRQLYREYKKTDEYNLYISDLEKYKEIVYPNMTSEEIEHSITNGEAFSKQTYQFLLEQGKEFTRMKRNKN